jgi:hypothetical protein
VINGEERRCSAARAAIGATYQQAAGYQANDLHGFNHDDPQYSESLAGLGDATK